jgi:hypothetical protein
MLKDEWFDILLNTDVNDMQKVCYTNKNTINICTNPYFWQQKFNHDAYPLLSKNNTSLQDWINEYNAIRRADRLATYLIELVTMEYVNKPSINFKFNITDELMFLPSEMIHDIKNNDDYINHIDEPDEIWISFNFFDYCEDEECQKNHFSLNYLLMANDDIIAQISYELSLNDIQKMIRLIFYIYPDIDPFDSFYQSYLWNNHVKNGIIGNRNQFWLTTTGIYKFHPQYNRPLRVWEML